MFDLHYSGTLVDLAWSLWMGWGIMVPLVGLWHSSTWRISGGKRVPLPVSR
ncbi:MAG: hypothetical protein ACE5IQ_03600 [Candidatus Methylomirabilales bacterium]